MLQTADGQPYYWDKEAQKTQWGRPDDMKDELDAEIRKNGEFDCTCRGNILVPPAAPRFPLDFYPAWQCACDRSTNFLTILTLTPTLTRPCACALLSTVVLL